MSLTIHIQNEANFDVDADALQFAALTTLGAYDVHPDSEMTIVITDNETVESLNQTHRGISAPTDVLSFPAEPLPDGLTDEDEGIYIGDTIIAYPYARQQAELLGHDLTHSLMLLVVHSTLHLLGYDHDTPENRAVMWTEQADILTELNIPTDYVPALETNEHD